MAKAVLAGLFLLHGMIDNSVSDAVAGVIALISTRNLQALVTVSGELTLERKRDGKKQHFASGQGVSETVDTFHRGVAGNEPVVLIVFYAGSPGVPLTQYPCKVMGSRRRMKPSPAERQSATSDSTREDSKHVAR